MDGLNKKFSDKLEEGVRELIDECKSPLKSAKCFDFDAPEAVPCKCKDIMDIRLQIKALRKAQQH